MFQNILNRLHEKRRSKAGQESPQLRIWSFALETKSCEMRPGSIARWPTANIRFRYFRHAVQIQIDQFQFIIRLSLAAPNLGQYFPKNLDQFCFTASE